MIELGRHLVLSRRRVRPRAVHYCKVARGFARYAAPTRGVVALGVLVACEQLIESNVGDGGARAIVADRLQFVQPGEESPGVSASSFAVDSAHRVGVPRLENICK